MPVGCVLADKGIGCKCKRLRIRRSVDHEQGQQEVVPDPHNIDDDNCGGYRLQQREDDAEEQPETGSAVHRGALVNFPGNTLDESMVDKDGKRRSEAPVQQAESPGALGQAQIFGQLQHGQHNGLERNQHRHDAQDIDEAAEPGFGPGQLVGCDGGHQHNARQANHRNDQIVKKKLWIVDELPYIGVIIECQMLGQRDNVCHDFAEAFERVDERQEQRIEEQERQDDHDGLKRNFARRIRFILHSLTSLSLKKLGRIAGCIGFIHQASTSLRLKKANWIIVTMSTATNRMSALAVP
ncbi:hypothetical protein D3C71_1377400 [compost metagenome]